MNLYRNNTVPVFLNFALYKIIFFYIKPESPKKSSGLGPSPIGLQSVGLLQTLLLAKKIFLRKFNLSENPIKFSKNTTKKYFFFLPDKISKKIFKSS